MDVSDAQPIAALAQQLGLAPDERQLRQLQDYLALLQRWNKTYNLTALRDPAQIFTHHLADCLAALPPLQRVLAGCDGLRLLDVGSGGGLPGVLIAVLCPGLQVSCVDTVGKKAAFIRQVGAELGLRNLRAEHARVEQLPGRYELITSRAFATLADFVALTRERLAPEGLWMAMKGKRPEEEIATLPTDVEAFHVERLAVPGLDAERCLVWMRLQR
ncbi:16S rRNA (guanine(527)-N(7))-methyltransferase RsmG [uncultured Azohydromonas sp.]|jgi:16S rRNA (guanine(527)-N(7))-methyltransferase GidB|uniref:16S rRNA (guanine(527)-N(7))-methyltransferase RsmG n=1 Tax=uncultured Azohydromonas sp. TaxID=487342 RepID=UPI00260F1D39|nr:16S rRNA (guanine(527)-N(7))-methyltransferase RsmG [uncultured Azohydromonas sp.]